MEWVALLVSAILLSLFFGMSLSLILEQLLPPKPEGMRLFLQFLVSSVSFQGVALVLFQVFLKKHGVGWKELLGLNGPRLRRVIGLGLAVGLVVLPAALLLNNGSALLMKLLHLTPEDQPTLKVLQASSGVWQRVWFGLAAILVAPLVEEVLFRGILYPAIKQKGHPHLAFYGTSILFAAIHSNLMTFIPLTFFAMVLVMLYERTDSLMAPITAHCFFNAVNFCLFLLEPQLTRWLDFTHGRV